MSQQLTDSRSNAQPGAGVNTSTSRKALQERVQQQSEVISYEDIATELPDPPESLVTTPSRKGIETDYTVLTSNTESDFIWNRPQMDWRQLRAKYSTIMALYPLAMLDRLARGVNPPIDDPHLVHTVYSPDTDEITSKADIDQLRTDATTFAQENGLEGGVAAFHAFRTNDDIDNFFESQVEQTPYSETATDVLKWEWLRQSGTGNGWRSHVHWGPHVHLIGITNGTQPTETHGDTVFTTVRNFVPYDPDVPELSAAELRAVTKDIMDHYTFHREDPTPPLRWFGALQGDRWVSAKQHVTDTKLNSLREHLINGPQVSAKQIISPRGD